ncbi:MAG: PKD domain-containing protein, partial [Patescibacteria group bacterium]
MKLKLHKVLNVITSLSLLVNSIYAPLSVYAQEITPSPTPAPIIEETASPEPSVSPSEEPIVSPSPTIESTILPTVSSTPIESPLPSENQSTEPTSTVTPLKTEEKGHIEAIILENTQASSIEGYDLEYQDEGSATIQTDKLDYAPTDTVLITGSEFLPNTEYGIEITSDTGNFKFSDRVTSDESGGLFYTYQLDGTYRPNYVVVINSGEVMIASTSFSDSDWPGCGFQCEAGDAYVKELQLVDSGGSPLNTCTPGTLVTATIRGNFYVNSNSDRKAVILLGDIYQGNNLHYHFSTSGVDGQCVGDALSHGDNYRDLYTFSWTCGEAVSIKNLVLSWTTGNTSCANFFSAPSCGNRTTKCYSSQDFIVSSPLVANFSANNVCLGNSTTFTDSTAGGITPYSYSWDFGDTNSSSLQNPLHMYSAAGSYSVNLDVDDSAVPTQSDNESETVEVWANPQVDFSFSQSSCPGMAVNFTNNSGAGLPNGGQIQNYLWSFGDGTTSTDINPSHSYSSSGVYTVALSANDFNSCSALIQKEITVNACYGDLTVRKNVITDVDDQVDEFDVDTWTWDLDDGDQDYQTGSTQNILVGSHLINEDPKNDYHVVNLSCTDPAGNTTDYGAVESAQIDVSVNGLECTFVNAIDTGLVTFEKEIYEDDPYLPSDWEFFVDGQTVAHGGQIALPVGSYNVDELNSDNDLFNLTSVSGICSDPNDQGADKSATLIVTKDGGTGTFTNT